MPVAGAGRPGADLRRPRLPLQLRPVHGRRPLRARASTTSTRRRRASSAPTRSTANPAHVTYVVNPTMDFPGAGTVADHAYWLSGLKLRDSERRAPLWGRSTPARRASGYGDPAENPTQTEPGTLQGGNLGRLPYVERSKSWGAAPQTTARNVLHLDAENLAQVSRPPAPGAPQLPPAARRHHRRAADPDARRLRPHAPLRRPVARSAGSPRPGLGRFVASLGRSPMDLFLATCQGIGLALAAGTFGGASGRRGVDRLPARRRGRDRRRDPVRRLAGHRRPPRLAGLAGGRGDRRVHLRDRQRRRRRRPGAARGRLVDRADRRRWARWSSPPLSLFVEPVALVALLAIVWLGSARRRRAQRKYEGLRVLR